MTTYAPNFTSRVRIHYHVCGIDHTIQMRAARGATLADMGFQIEAIRASFSAMSDELCEDFAWLSTEYALTDSNDFFPTANPADVTGGTGLSSYSLQQRITALNFNGRAVGSRASIYFYGVQFLTGGGQPADNGRVTQAEYVHIDDVLAQLNPAAHAGSGQLAAFHNYANVKVNDHFLKLLRRGTIS